MVEFIESIIYNQVLDTIESEFLISKTDIKGRIIYVNDLFCKIAGYSREELLGKPHNIVRHPDMPKQIFKELWNTIKKQKKPWTGIIKNKRKDGSHYWVLATIFPVFEPDYPEEIKEFISFRKEITELMEGFERDLFYSKLYQILNQFHRMDNLKDILEYALNTVLKFPWLEVENKGGIMLWNERTKELEMFVHKGVGKSLLEMCNRVPEGRCLCGKAVQSKNIIFKDCVDDDHDNRPTGMQPHGHYNVPLIFNQKLMGVMFLYVQHGHRKKQIEENFLQLLGNVLGSMIFKFKIQKELEEANLKNFLTIQHIKTYSSRSTYQYVKEVLSNGNIDGSIEEKPLLKNRYLHLLFLDIVNYTKFAEQRSPEKVVEILNSFFAPIIDMIYQHDGDIDKFIGDAIFGYFEDASSCLESALDIVDYLEDEKKNPYRLQCRIGIHSGFTIHTDLGSDLRKDFTLIGDTVNTAQRIERASRPNQILVSEAFVHHLPDTLYNNIEFSSKYLLKAKNKSKNVYVYFVKKSKKELTSL